MRRFLVTGAQGLVGRYLIARLLEQDPGAQVLGLGRSPECDASFSHGSPLPPALRSTLASSRERYRYAPVALRDGAALSETVRSFDPECVFHLASALHSAPEPQLLDTNVQGTLSLLNALSGHRALLVHGSSASVYGEPRQLPMPETHPCKPVDVYGVSKLAAEQLVALKAARGGAPFFIARIFNIVGPGQTAAHACGRFAKELVALQRSTQPVLEVGPLHPTRDFVDVRDVAQGLVDIARRGKPGETYNLASGTETAIGEVLRELVRAAGTDLRVVERGDRPAGVSRHVADVSKLAQLGYAPRYSLAQSLGELVHYERWLADRTPTRAL